MATRYFVSDLQTSIDFYTGDLGFALLEQWGPAFAIVSLGDVTLWLSGPGTSAAKPMPDGSQPVPGGWNRIVVALSNLEETVERLRKNGTTFRGDVISGPGGTQVLIEDPDGNPVELFESRS